MNKREDLWGFVLAVVFTAFSATFLYLLNREDMAFSISRLLSSYLFAFAFTSLLGPRVGKDSGRSYHDIIVYSLLGLAVGTFFFWLVSPKEGLLLWVIQAAIAVIPFTATASYYMVRRLLRPWLAQQTPAQVAVYELGEFLIRQGFLRGYNHRFLREYLHKAYACLATEGAGYIVPPDCVTASLGGPWIWRIGILEKAQRDATRSFFLVFTAGSTLKGLKLSVDLDERISAALQEHKLAFF